MAYKCDCTPGDNGVKCVKLRLSQKIRDIWSLQRGQEKDED